MTDMSWMPWVVGGVMVLSFLYMKVWPFVRTIIRAFRGPRFKSKSKLSVEQYKKLSIGSLYAWYNISSADALIGPTHNNNPKKCIFNFFSSSLHNL